jgi:hypothetical protein
VDRFVDPADRALEGYFSVLREETLALVRPPGAFAARRAAQSRYQRRRLFAIVAAAVALVVTALGGGYALAGGHLRVEPAGPSQESWSPSPAGTEQPAPSLTPVAGELGPSAGTDSGPAGGPVPPGMTVTSITFIDVNTAWALGYAPCLTPHDWHSCPAVIRSRDGGRTWAGVPVPGNAAYYGDIRFATSRDGWVVVRATISAGDPRQDGVLYSTHDGGATWKQVSLPEPARYLETSGGRVWLSTGSNPVDPPHSVYSAPITSDTFTRAGDGNTGGLTVHGHYAYAYGTSTLTVFKDGTRINRQLPCDASHRTTAFVAAWADQGLAAVCTGSPQADTEQKLAFTSTDGGATWSPAGAPDPGGHVTGLAATTTDMFIGGAAMPLRERGSGGSWSPVLAPQGPLATESIGYVGFTDDQHGVALVDGGIAQSSDGGHTWRSYHPSSS